MPPLYPVGPAGVGLLILRLAAAGSLVVMSLPLTAASDFRQAIGLLLAAGLCVGLRVRVVAAVSLLWAADALARGVTLAPVAGLHAAIALALTLTGAGAYSADARLFGRRRVKLPARYDTSE